MASTVYKTVLFGDLYPGEEFCLEGYEDYKHVKINTGSIQSDLGIELKHGKGLAYSIRLNWVKYWDYDEEVKVEVKPVAIKEIKHGYDFEYSGQKYIRGESISGEIYAYRLGDYNKDRLARFYPNTIVNPL